MTNFFLQIVLTMPEKGKEEWAIEVNGTCEHLSKGEQFHWTF